MTRGDRGPVHLRYGLVARSVAAVPVGLAGTAAILRWHGPLVVHPPVGRSGFTALLAIAFVWTTAATFLGRRWSWLWLSRLTALGATLALTAANVGRLMGAVSIAMVFVAHAVLVDWSPGPRSPGRPDAVAWAALAPLAASSWLWASRADVVATVALLAVTMAAVEVHHRAPNRFDSIRGRGVAVGEALRRRTAETCRAIWNGLSDPDRSGLSWPVVAVAAASVVLMAPVWYRYASSPAALVGTTDYETHLDAARRLSLIPLRISAPHPAFHAATAVLAPVVGWAWAATLVLSAASASAAVVLLWWGRWGTPDWPPLSRWSAVLAAVGFLLVESPGVAMQLVGVGDIRDWSTVVHAYHSPTDSMAVGISLALVLLVARSVASSTMRTRRVGRLLSAVSFASLVTKPSMALALLPVVVVSSAAPRWRKEGISSFLWRWLIAPTVVGLMAQTLLLEIGTPDLSPSGVVIEPFATVRVLELDRSGPLLVSWVLVVVLAGLIGRRFFKEPAVWLSLGSALVGAVILVLFRETGVRAEDGAFAKPALMASFAVYVVAWRFVLGEVRDRWRSQRWGAFANLWVVSVMAFGIVSAVGGVAAYLEALGAVELPGAVTR